MNYEASSGRYFMLLNDDVVARTKSWDRIILSCLNRYPDGIILVHTNDNLFREVLCTFPIVSRTFCELVGGICPLDYIRYRIDDHIEDLFNLLWVLGERRTIYLPDVHFEHFRYVEEAEGNRQYILNEKTLALDAERFLSLLPERKRLALELKQYLASPATLEEKLAWSARLEQVHDPFSLRVPERLRVERETPNLRRRVDQEFHRIQECVRLKGYGGLARAVWKRIVPRPQRPALSSPTETSRGESSCSAS
jgi:hypothetical protein